MFVRFRQSDKRLRLSLVETRRQAGKVVHEHVSETLASPLERWVQVWVIRQTWHESRRKPSLRAEYRQHATDDGSLTTIRRVWWSGSHAEAAPVGRRSEFRDYRFWHPSLGKSPFWRLATLPRSP